MKRLALIVGAFAMTATVAHAQDATEMKNGGEFRVRYENFFNKSASSASGQEQHTDARLKWDMNIRKGEKLQAHLTLLNNNRFGGASSEDATSSANPAAYNFGSPSGLNVNRAWGWWRASDTVSFKVGRIGIDFADGAVFSDNDWQAVPTAHDGLNVAFDTSFATFNVYGIKVSEVVTPTTASTVAGNSDPETNFYLLTMDLKNMPQAVKMANIHLLDVVGDATSATPSLAANNTAQNWQHVGLTVGGDVAAFIYKVTAAFQFGKSSTGATTGANTQDQSLSSNMFDVMVGYGLPDVAGLKLSAGYHMDSGDDSTTDGSDNTYKSLYYDRHNYAGLMDVVRWGNLSYWNLNVSVMPAEDLEAGVGFYMFSKTKSGGATTFGSGIVSTATTTNDSALGSEVDLFANKSYGPDLKIGARYSMFMTGNAMKNATPAQDKMSHEGYLQASIAF